ncbi:hypothetical protein X975_12713, partial [Stegodyphus mimosarum]
TGKIDVSCLNIWFYSLPIIWHKSFNLSFQTVRRLLNAYSIRHSIIYNVYL